LAIRNAPRAIGSTLAPSRSAQALLNKPKLANFVPRLDERALELGDLVAQLDDPRIEQIVAVERDLYGEVELLKCVFDGRRR
jgi:hypothetical protein